MIAPIRSPRGQRGPRPGKLPFTVTETSPEKPALTSRLHRTVSGCKTRPPTALLSGPARREAARTQTVTEATFGPRGLEYPGANQIGGCLRPLLAPPARGPRHCHPQPASTSTHRRPTGCAARRTYDASSVRRRRAPMSLGGAWQHVAPPPYQGAGARRGTADRRAVTRPAPPRKVSATCGWGWWASASQCWTPAGALLPRWRQESLPPIPMEKRRGSPVPQECPLRMEEGAKAVCVWGRPLKAQP